VVNTVVVWLHILSAYWCLYVVVFGSGLLQSTAEAQINALSDDDNNYDYDDVTAPKHVGAV